MGERGNIVVLQHKRGLKKADGELYLYTHWGGACLPVFVHAVLARRLHWDDESHLAHLLISALMQGDANVGVTTYLTDNEYPLLYLDTATASVTMRPENKKFKTWTFEEFIQIDIDVDDPWGSIGYDEDDDCDDCDEVEDECGAKRFEFSDGKSNKFWEITLEDDSYTVRFGKIGTEGQRQTKTFEDEDNALREYNKVIAEKRKKGYLPVS